MDVYAVLLTFMCLFLVVALVAWFLSALNHPKPPPGGCIHQRNAYYCKICNPPEER